jgi:hypothetical protein
LGATLNGQRPRDDAKTSKLCLCGHNKFWGQCPYIVTSLRARGFVEDPEKAKKIAEFKAADRRHTNKIRRKNWHYKKQKSKVTDKQANSGSIEMDAGNAPADQLLHKAYAIFSSAFNNQLALQHYLLLHLWMLDPATNSHICNNSTEFEWKAPAANNNIVLAGRSETPIEAWREVTISLSTPTGIKTITLKRVALILSFFTSLVLLSRLTSLNIYFNSG